jgi:replicative DNA helicase
MPEQTRRSARKQKPAATAEENFSHIQPQALDLERAVLGALMVDGESYSLISDILRPESFYLHKNSLIFDAIQKLSFDQKPVDMLTVTNKLKELGELDEVGGSVYVAELCENVTGSAHIVYHAAIIAQKALARQLISYTSRIQTNAFDETLDINDVMQEAEADLFELSKQNIKKDYTQIDPVIDEAYKQLHEAAKRKDGMSGIPSGFHKLDKITSGWQKSNLIIIAARPAMGKTAFALSMARNIAVDQRIPIAMFSLEMSNVELVNRLISNVCQIRNDKIRSGQLEPYEWIQLDNKITELQGAPIYVDDTPQLSIFELRTKARRMVHDHGVKLIMIDYLQLMNANGSKFGSRQEEVSTISRSLKGLAKELDIPIIALSQVNRNVEQRGTMPGSTNEGQDAKRPQLSDLRESGAIEQDADMVIFIHRPEYYKIMNIEGVGDTKGQAEIIIAKHRNGAVGSVWLTFKSEFARFLNREDNEIASGNGPVEVGSKMNDDIGGAFTADENIGPAPTAFPPASESDDPPF